MPVNRDDRERSAGTPGFEEFQSELPPGVRDVRAAGAWNVPVPHTTVSLAELMSSGIAIDSYEAIAIIEGLCSSFIDSGDRVGPAELDSSGVFIHAVGAVSAASDGRRDALA